MSDQRLDLRDLKYRNKVKKLAEHYRKAADIWKPYPIDPQLKEPFETLATILEDYLDRFDHDLR